MGLTYNRFHVTAVCSPTRAALLTGRNHHRVGFGSVAEFPGPFPGYTAARPRSCTAFPRILQENGYVTGGFGKWHLTPDNVQGAAGPFDHWPQSWGFDHWWGFLSGAAGQYDPIITQDNSTLGVPEGKDGKPYYFPDDLTDKAVEWLHAVRAQDAQKPWFMYYSTGCAHAPHHVARRGPTSTRASSTRAGTRTARRRSRARRSSGSSRRTPSPHRAAGVCSQPGTRLTTPRRSSTPGRWRSSRASPENADWNVGRLLDAIEEMGDLDNTLIFYIWGDNGASMEGTLTGSFNEMTFLNGVVLDAEQQLKLIEQYGGIDAWAATTQRRTSLPPGPMPATRRSNGASRWRATSVARAIRWSSPGRTASSPMVICARSLPTASTSARRFSRPLGIPEPKTVDGIEQEPMDGTSFLYTFDDAKAAERHTVQYFEMFGSRAIYKDGWWACARLDKAPWDFSPKTLKQFAPGVYDPEQDVVGAVLPA